MLCAPVLTHTSSDCGGTKAPPALLCVMLPPHPSVRAGETPNVGLGTPADCAFYAANNFTLLFDKVGQDRSVLGTVVMLIV
jgi:hypothetical protein